MKFPFNSGTALLNHIEKETKPWPLLHINSIQMLTSTRGVVPNNRFLCFCLSISSTCPGYFNGMNLTQQHETLIKNDLEWSKIQHFEHFSYHSLKYKQNRKKTKSLMCTTGEGLQIFLSCSREARRKHLATWRFQSYMGKNGAFPFQKISYKMNIS